MVAQILIFSVEGRWSLKAKFYFLFGALELCSPKCRCGNDSKLALEVYTARIYFLSDSFLCEKTNCVAFGWSDWFSYFVWGLAVVPLVCDGWVSLVFRSIDTRRSSHLFSLNGQINHLVWRHTAVCCPSVSVKLVLFWPHCWYLLRAFLILMLQRTEYLLEMTAFEYFIIPPH